MLDKDKLILLFNIYEPDDIDSGRFLYIANGFKEYFDESVKCIFSVTRDETKPLVQNITDFPDSGMKLIKELVKSYESRDEEALNIQIEAVKSFLKEYKK